MDIIERYAELWNYHVSHEKHIPYTPPMRERRSYVPLQAHPITISTDDVRSRDFITAHDMKDYRRETFNLILLPKVNLPYDIIAKEVYGL